MSVEEKKYYVSPLVFLLYSEGDQILNSSEDVNPDTSSEDIGWQDEFGF